MIDGSKSRHLDRDLSALSALAPISDPTTTAPILPQPSQSTLYSSYPSDALTVRRGLDEARALRRVEAPEDLGAAEVRTGKAEHRRARSTGRRQRHGAELGATLHPLDGAQQLAERAREVRLVEQHQGVVPEEPRVRRPKRAPVAIAREQKPRPHHVDGADEHRGPRGVEPPRAVVGEAPAQHPEPHGVGSRMRGLTIERAAKRGQRSDALDPCAHQLHRLVDDGAAVDDVDDAPRQRRVREACKQREQHARGLAEPGGDVDRVRDRTARQRRVKAALPRVTPAAAAVRHSPPRPMTPPQARPGGRRCATSTTASARFHSSGPLHLRASRAANSRAPPAPSPRCSSACATDSSQRRSAPRRSRAPERRRNLVQNLASTDPPRGKGSSNATTSTIGRWAVRLRW